MQTSDAKGFESMLKSFLRSIFAPLGLALALTGAPAADKVPQAAHPALWTVADADTTVYLFGTIHLLPEKYRWRTPAFDQAVSGSNQLMVETIVDEKNPQKLMSALTSLAFSKGLPPLAARVPPAQRPALDAAIAKSGIPRQAFDSMETWAAAFMLLGAIDQPQSMNAEFTKMLGAWGRGDVNAIARTFNHDLAASPELKEALIAQRNANWSRWIEQRMATPGSVMIAVGAGHLAGKDSVIDMLKRSGYRVRRVQ